MGDKIRPLRKGNMNHNHMYQGRSYRVCKSHWNLQYGMILCRFWWFPKKRAQKSCISLNPILARVSLVSSPPRPHLTGYHLLSHSERGTESTWCSICPLFYLPPLPSLWVSWQTAHTQMRHHVLQASHLGLRYFQAKYSPLGFICINMLTVLRSFRPATPWWIYSYLISLKVVSPRNRYRIWDSL